MCIALQIVEKLIGKIKIKKQMIKIYIDGGTRGSRICLVDKNENKIIIKTRGGKPTNNELEYLALLYALEYCNNRHKNDYVEIYSDSRLVVNQINGKWRITTETLKPLYEKCSIKMRDNYILKWISRDYNLAGHVLEG